jgi:glutamate N-acetyltransferase/amino-acid N-acetyltransferase
MEPPLEKSPLAPSHFPSIPPIGGVRFSVASAGIKYVGRTDIMLAELSPGTSIAGVFTKSATRAAPVLDCQDKIGGETGEGAAIIINSGNANAFTGKEGGIAVKSIAIAVSQQLMIPETRVFSSSTGVIGEPLPYAKVTDCIAALNTDLDAGSIAEAAQAIMTTDTYAKGAYLSIETKDGPVKLAGIAKGSGMIAPDMATMLVYLFTDAKIEQSDLQNLLSEVNETTFNAITVDSDTSTSDTVLLAATGASKIAINGENNAFRQGLHKVMLDLAHQVVRDGEGARKFIEICVQGAIDDADAKTHAMAIANSPLVKTAIAGSDPNWGRIVMAIGKSGAAADRDRLKIWFGDILVATKGWVVDLGIGPAKSKVWTCDLTHQYITINADYRS